jgi:hypothetical protein
MKFQRPLSVTAASLFVLLSVSIPASAQPIGPEFRVNTYTTGDQVGTGVARTAGGGFVVVWGSPGEDGEDGGHSVLVRAFSQTGAPLGDPLRVNTFTAGEQWAPRVASDGSGRFAVVWTSDGQDGDAGGIYGQRFTIAADQPPVPAGVEFRVSEATTFDQEVPDIAMTSTGDFVVTWWSDLQGENGIDVYARRFSNSGAPFAGEFRVNTHTAGTQWQSRAAVGPAGSFAIVWQGAGGSGADEVYVRLFGAGGAPLGPEFRVNSYTTGSQGNASVQIDAAGKGLVAWSGPGEGGHGSDVYAQRFDALGQPAGVEFRVNTYTTGFQGAPSVSYDAGGRFVVSWSSGGQPGGQATEIVAQRYAADAPAGDEFRVNTYTTSFQVFPNVASTSTGDFVIVWQGYGVDEPNIGIYGRAFAAGIHGDVNGSGDVTVLDVFYLINLLFAGGPAPLGGADANGDGSINVLDVFYLINSLFANGPPPV